MVGFLFEKTLSFMGFLILTNCDLIVMANTTIASPTWTTSSTCFSPTFGGCAWTSPTLSSSHSSDPRHITFPPHLSWLWCLPLRRHRPTLPHLHLFPLHHLKGAHISLSFSYLPPWRCCVSPSPPSLTKSAFT